jgi:thioredoxin 1
MASIELTTENFEETVATDGIVLADWFANWCGPCKQFAPVFEDSSNKHSDIVFGKVNTEEQQQLAANFKIRSIPTLMAFRDGILVFSQAGALSSPQLEELIENVRNLDMDNVRNQIARRSNAALN